MYASGVMRTDSASVDTPTQLALSQYLVADNHYQGLASRVVRIGSVLLSCEEIHALP